MVLSASYYPEPLTPNDYVLAQQQAAYIPMGLPPPQPPAYMQVPYVKPYLWPYRKLPHDSTAWMPSKEQDAWTARMLQRQPAPKSYEYQEEVKTGGVSAQLDYNIDAMAEFLCTMSSAIMGFKSSPSLLKFTHQLLSSTRLPGSTIILSLVYLSKRCALQMPVNDHTSQYHLLIVSLILANKFNDDNTFTNKSWAEVTGLPIAELSRVETNWLVLINWRLNLNDFDLGIWTKWNDHWVEFMIEKQRQQWYDRHDVYVPQMVYGEQYYQPQQQLVSSYSAHCNCNYCVFEPIMPAWSGPAAAAC